MTPYYEDKMCLKEFCRGADMLTGFPANRSFLVLRMNGAIIARASAVVYLSGPGNSCNVQGLLGSNNFHFFHLLYFS